jgi:hypothetical protein
MSTDRGMARIKKLNTPDLVFQEATDEVVTGYDLTSSGNRAYGKNVYISTGSAPAVDRARLISGVRIAIDSSEMYGLIELRCARDAGGETVSVALFDPQSLLLSRILTATAPREAREIDEGLLAWLGPAETYGTAWSDGGAAVCQVVTVERLRRYARKAQPNTAGPLE